MCLTTPFSSFGAPPQPMTISHPCRYYSTACLGVVPQASMLLVHTTLLGTSNWLHWSLTKYYQSSFNTHRVDSKYYLAIKANAIALCLAFFGTRIVANSSYLTYHLIVHRWLPLRHPMGVYPTSTVTTCAFLSGIAIVHCGLNFVWPHCARWHE
jgi:hypothetical protein